MIKPTRGDTAAHEMLNIEAPAKLRKRPRQARSVVLVDALKQTGREMLEKEGRDVLSTARLSERSGVAISSIYEYFPTMDSLVSAIFKDYRAEAYREALESIRALPPSATLFDGIVLVLRIGMAMLHKCSQIDAAFSVKSVHYEELVRLDLVKPENSWAPAVTSALLARFPDEILVQDRQKARFLAYQTLLALPRAMAVENPEYLNAADTPLMLARMLHALLTTETD